MAHFTRILSDLHYGDRSSRVRSLAQVKPLLDGPAALILNGDTLDTREGPAPALTASLREEVRTFFPRHIAATTFLTGNHDADITTQHTLEFAGGRVFVTHGDIIYPDIVPWSQDAATIRSRLAEEFSRLTDAERVELETRLEVFRRVAASLPQRHQSQRNPLKYAAAFARDTIWPPTRSLKIIQAWRDMPELAAALLRQYRPAAKFIVLGHTHRPGIWHLADGIVVVNTGSFSRPLGGYAVDIASDRLAVRRIEPRRGEFLPGKVLAEFSLATT